MSQAEFFDAEPAIIARLNDQLKQGSPPAAICKQIAAAATIAGASINLSGHTPCIFVAPGETEAPDDGSDDGDSPETQTWEIAVCVAHKPDANRFDVITAQLDGGLLLKVKAALTGYAVAGGAVLVYAGRPAPSFQDERFPGVARFFINFKLAAMPSAS